MIPNEESQNSESDWNQHPLKDGQRRFQNCLPWWTKSGSRWSPFWSPSQRKNAACRIAVKLWRAAFCGFGDRVWGTLAPDCGQVKRFEISCRVTGCGFESRALRCPNVCVDNGLRRATSFTLVVRRAAGHQFGHQGRNFQERASRHRSEAVRFSMRPIMLGRLGQQTSRRSNAGSFRWNGVA